MKPHELVAGRIYYNTKTEEEVDFVVLDWNGLGKAEERERIIEILERLYIAHKKISEISN